MQSHFFNEVKDGYEGELVIYFHKKKKEKEHA